MRLILDFDEAVYKGEQKIWYLLDSTATVTISDILVDLSAKFSMNLCAHAFYVNGVVAPDWNSSKMINANDNIYISRPRSSSAPREYQGIPTEITQNHDMMEPSALLSLKCAKNVAKISTKDDTQPTETSVKINNNFKRRKMPNTTPTAKDRYTNRSKVYVSPGAKTLSRASSTPISSVLQTAIKETLHHSPNKRSPPRKHKPSVIVAESVSKTKIFQDKVSTLLAAQATQVDSSSEDDSSVENQPKKLRKTKESSSSSAESDDESLVKPTVESSSDDSDPEGELQRPAVEAAAASASSSECSNSEEQPKKIQKVTPLTPESSSDEESEVEAKVAVVTIQKPESSSDGEDESDTEEVLPTKPVKRPAPQSSDSDDSEEEEKTQSLNKPSTTGNIKTGCVSSDSEEESDDDAKTAGKATKIGLRDYSTFVDLQGPPRVSDKLAFKMLDLNESYCPVVSSYKEGIITEYAPEQQQVTVQLLPQFISLGPKDGRFEMEGTGVGDEVITLSLKQLIDPKLLS